MKIKILFHYRNRHDTELFENLDISINDLPKLPTVTCALIDKLKQSELHLFESMPCTQKLQKVKEGQYLYFFSYIQLRDFLSKSRKEELSALYNPLNELRLKTEALDYSYPESPSMYNLDLSGPKIMAVLNITPDSFSDGGRYFKPDKAYHYAMQLISEGADILDIGGESSRPGADQVPEKEELARIIPVIERIRKNSDIIISVDTYKVNVARRALEAGANWINDISGLRYDPEMEILAKEKNCPVVIMHMQGTPQTMQTNPGYENVITEILDFFQERIDHLKDLHVTKIILDPGIGFGKRPEDNVNIIKHLELFKQFGYPVMIGASRKSFIGQITGREVGEREAGTLAAHALALLNGAAIVRTHEVNTQKDLLKIVKNFS